ncbi:ATP-binding cassette domain-containing protein [Salipaludibacillus sp. CF4.18]|uniref:ATP-binding cassette domain-containing protein n=1 Tax=Salipaludibacillus sp. CF4.18 TaxID=3373081 RepID=UPI003EE73052
MMIAIKLTNILKRFIHGSETTLLFKDLNLSVNEGELVVISGDEGTGKSTLLRMIAAMTPANKGIVQVFGEDVVTIKKRSDWRMKNIGYINDEGLLTPFLTAKQNLLMDIKEDSPEYKDQEQKAINILTQLGFSTENFNDTIEGLDDKHQVLAIIARILMTGPKLILADEPLKSLEGSEGAGILEELLTFAKQEQTTVIICTDDPAISSKADRHYRIESNKLVEKSKQEPVL